VTFESMYEATDEPPTTIKSYSAAIRAKSRVTMSVDEDNTET
jgi:hypothetical protein